VTSAPTRAILDTILARTAADVAARKSATSIDELERVAATRPPALSLRQALAGPHMSIIAEIKRASPSRGTFPTVVDPPAVTADYISGGAAAISVLTDEPFFQGELRDMEQAAEVAHAAAQPVPVLRKDFMVEPYQVVEARARGADAILLIVAALSDAMLTDLLAQARSWGMDALVEVHDETELKRAVDAGAAIIGVNNRDLRTFNVDLAVTERLAPLAPADAVVVAESGIFDRGDVARVARAGANAVLVGESLITAPDRSSAVAALLS
jgi:indole-3-glycerol phosphate synthase